MTIRSLTLSRLQTRKLSDILADSGVAFLASVVIPVLFGSFSLISLVIGTLAALFLWLMSLSLVK